jgi:hypothetical protein
MKYNILYYITILQWKPNFTLSFGGSIQTTALMKHRKSPGCHGNKNLLMVPLLSESYKSVRIRENDIPLITFQEE